MRLHVLTAVSRPGNLPMLAKSLATAATNSPDTELVWHWALDLDHEHIGGQAVKNRMLDDIRERDGWVWVMDDDTLAHPDLFQRIADYAHGRPFTQAVVVSQKRADGTVLTADPGCVIVGQIDIGQAVMTRSLIGRHRLPIDYNGDGLFLHELLLGRRVAYLPEILSFHNALETVAA